MGLDNGLTLRTRKQIDPNLVPSYVEITAEPTNDALVFEYEVCYWRKCWNIRDMIFNCLGDVGKDNSSCEVSISALESIRDGIYEFLCNGDDWEDSIWDFDEMIDHLSLDIVNLSWVINYLKEDPHAYVYFYDSY